LGPKHSNINTVAGEGRKLAIDAEGSVSRRPKGSHTGSGRHSNR
jgi:hypothetical protein